MTLGMIEQKFHLQFHHCATAAQLAELEVSEVEVPIDVIDSVTIVGMIHLCQRTFQHGMR